MIQRAFRYRLYPTAEQAQTLAQFAGATRFVYNLALEQRRTFWRQYRAQTGGVLNFVSQGRQVTQLRREVDWLGGVPSVFLLQCLRDLDKAYSAFFCGRARYPTNRCKGVNDSFRLPGGDTVVRKINRKWSFIRVPKLGLVKFRDTRPTRGRTVNATIAWQAGQWFVSFACQIEHEAPANDLPAVGIDRGVVNTLALSTGEMLSTPDVMHLQRRKRTAQQTLSRRVRGSRRYRRQRQRLAMLSAKIARVRADWQHKASLDVARRFGVVCIEDLKTVAMTRSGKWKRGLNRSILEQGWHSFETKLAYKLEERGGALIKINPAYTSQECFACGVIDSRNRESQASLVCRHCGFTDHADTNAAKVILRRGTAFMLVEGRGCAPVEARTFSHAA